jgi:anti-sigma factor (TIGR02949 family)
MPSDFKSTDPAYPGAPVSCEECRDLLSAYLDGELAADKRRRVAAHIEGCAACGEALADYGRIGRTLRQMGRVAAPPSLAARVRQTLDRAEANSDMAVRSAVAVLPSPRRVWPRSLAADFAAIAATCLVSVLTTWWVMSSANTASGIERELLNAHLRSLLQDSQVQIASSDQHTVRPWFTGRADFAPAVKDLAADGFPLVGGRLDYVADRRAGVLVYKRRLHVINVFMWPASAATAESAPRPASRNGYNLLTWTRNGITYAAVSDLNRDELRTLQGLL